MTPDLYDLNRAWGCMKKGVSLADCAARLGLKSSELDVALWNWRMSGGVSEAQFREEGELNRLRRLAPFDAVSARVLAAALPRAAA